MQYRNIEFETIKLIDEKIYKEKKLAKYFIEKIGKSITLEMIYIPSGKFMMGSRKDDFPQFGLPLHEVNISSFHLSQFQITREQWNCVLAYPNYEYNNEDSSERKHHPISSITWLKAIEFCQKLSTITGKNYRLPSEAEWEYACRAATNTIYSFGDEITTEVANYDELWYEKVYFDTTPVGSFYPNRFGLYDMHGNVFEFCQDSWHCDYDNAPNDGSAWINEENNNLVVIRGGSFDYDEDKCHCDYRSETPKNYTYHGTGFRV